MKEKTASSEPKSSGFLKTRFGRNLKAIGYILAFLLMWLMGKLVATLARLLGWILFTALALPLLSLSFLLFGSKFTAELGTQMREILNKHDL